jgi:hypothetical protein
MDDARLFDWLRYYARVILLLLVLGAGGSALAYSAYPPDATAGTIIVNTGTTIPPRSFGSVAIAVSRSSEVHERAAESLGVTEPLREFFQRHSEVVSVPGSNVMVVLGKARSQGEASRISSEVSRAVAGVLQDQTGDLIRMFRRSDRIEGLQGLSFSVAVSLGGTAGLLAGIALSVAFYRQRRPVLSMSRALRLLGAGTIVVYDAKKISRLAWLHPHRPRERAARELRSSPSSQKDFKSGEEGKSDGQGFIVVAHAGTRERDLMLESDAVEAIAGRPQLLWVV